MQRIAFGGVVLHSKMKCSEPNISIFIEKYFILQNEIVYYSILFIFFNLMSIAEWKYSDKKVVLKKLNHKIFFCQTVLQSETKCIYLQIKLNVTLLQWSIGTGVLKITELFFGSIIILYSFKSIYIIIFNISKIIIQMNSTKTINLIIFRLIEIFLPNISKDNEFRNNTPHIRQKTCQM